MAIAQHVLKAASQQLPAVTVSPPPENKTQEPLLSFPSPQNKICQELLGASDTLKGRLSWHLKQLYFRICTFLFTTEWYLSNLPCLGQCLRAAGARAINKSPCKTIPATTPPAQRHYLNAGLCIPLNTKPNSGPSAASTLDVSEIGLFKASIYRKIQILQEADTQTSEIHTHFPLGKTGSLSSSGTLRATSFKNKSSETVLL